MPTCCYLNVYYTIFACKKIYRPTNFTDKILTWLPKNEEACASVGQCSYGTDKRQKKTSLCCILTGSAPSDEAVSYENNDTDESKTSDDRQYDHRHFVLVHSMLQRVIYVRYTDDTMSYLTRWRSDSDCLGLLTSDSKIGSRFQPQDRCRVIT